MLHGNHDVTRCCEKGLIVSSLSLIMRLLSEFFFFFIVREFEGQGLKKNNKRLEAPQMSPVSVRAVILPLKHWSTSLFS